MSRRRFASARTPISAPRRPALRLLPSLALLPALSIIACLPGCQRSPDVDGPDTDLQHQIAEYMRRAADHGFSGAIVVEKHDGTILFSGAYGLADDSLNIPFTAETAVDIGSNSKAFVAAAVMALVEDGKLSVDGSIADYLPGVPDDKSDITVHQLLTHSSGLPDEYDESYHVRSREQMEREILSQPLQSAPGERYSYSDMGYALLAAIVERAADTPFRQYVRARLLRPNKLNQLDFGDAPEWEFNGGSVPVARGYNNGVDEDSPADQPHSGWTSIGPGGLLATVAAGARWHNELVQGRILGREATEKLFAKQIINRGTGEATIYYGYGWQIYFDPRRGNVISHSGATASHNWYSQYLVDDSLTIVAGSNRIDGKYEDANGDGYISDDEIISETIYAPQVSSRLAMAIHQNDFTIYPDFMVEEKSE